MRVVTNVTSKRVTGIDDGISKHHSSRTFMLTRLAFCFVAYIGACAFSACVFARRHTKAIFRKEQ
jgi:hypothetical protein